MLSATNGVCGILAIMYAIDGAFEFASALILAAMVFDGLDGAVARALGIKSPIGRDIDSIADMVSFCIAPAVLIYAWHYDPSAGTSLKILQGYTEGRAVNLLTVVASGGGMLLGMYRLMRFRTTDYGLDHFRGLPTPAYAFFILAAAHALEPVPLLVSAVLVGLLMTSHLRYPKITGAARGPAVIGIALLGTGLYLHDPRLPFLGALLLIMTYILLPPTHWAQARIRRRRRSGRR